VVGQSGDVPRRHPVAGCSGHRPGSCRPVHPDHRSSDRRRGGLGFNGGQLLHLAIAACISNDLFREAARLGITLSRVQVVVDGDFDGDPALSSSDRAVASRLPGNSGRRTRHYYRRMVRIPLNQEQLAAGQRLGAALREARGPRSMAEISAASGISTDTLRKIETGRIPTPAFATVAAIAAVLDVSLDELAESAVGFAPGLAVTVSA
jgi:DNA-binding Xre family transcriptional regulator